VARLKYRNARDAMPWLIEGMAAVAQNLASEVEAVTWAPTSDQRRWRRGFDQAELLARALAPRLALPAVRLLTRVAGPAQTGLSRLERARGPRFVCETAAPRAVLVVDDLLTSGATLAAAADALRRRGATRVNVVTAGRTPLKVAG
jgi:predicted amidophosphoribosyltransferase